MAATLTAPDFIPDVPAAGADFIPDPPSISAKSTPDFIPDQIAAAPSPRTIPNPTQRSYEQEAATVAGENTAIQNFSAGALKGVLGVGSAAKALMASNFSVPGMPETTKAVSGSVMDQSRQDRDLAADVPVTPGKAATVGQFVGPALLTGPGALTGASAPLAFAGIGAAQGAGNAAAEADELRRTGHQVGSADEIKSEIANAVIGALSGYLGGKALPASGNVATRAGLNVAAGAGLGGAERLAENAVVQNTIDPARQLTEGVAEATFGGGISQGVFSGIHEAGRAMAARPPVATPDFIPDSASTATRQAPAPQSAVSGIETTPDTQQVGTRRIAPQPLALPDQSPGVREAPTQVIPPRGFTLEPQPVIRRSLPEPPSIEIPRLGKAPIDPDAPTYRQYDELMKWAQAKGVNLGKNEAQSYINEFNEKYQTLPEDVQQPVSDSPLRKYAQTLREQEAAKPVDKRIIPGLNVEAMEPPEAAPSASGGRTSQDQSQLPPRQPAQADQLKQASDPSAPRPILSPTESTPAIPTDQSSLRQSSPDSIPLPKVHPDIHPDTVREAWETVASEYPEAARHIKEVRELDNYKYPNANASYSPETGILRVNASKKMTPETLAHEFEHVMQGLRGEAKTMADFVTEDDFDAHVEAPAREAAKKYSGQSPRPIETGGKAPAQEASSVPDTRSGAVLPAATGSKAKAREGQVDLDNYLSSKSRGTEQAMRESIESALKSGTFSLFVDPAGPTRQDRSKISAYRQLAERMSYDIGPETFNPKSHTITAAIKRGFTQAEASKEFSGLVDPSPTQKAAPGPAAGRTLRGGRTAGAIALPSKPAKIGTLNPERAWEVVHRKFVDEFAPITRAQRDRATPVPESSDVRQALTVYAGRADEAVERMERTHVAPIKRLVAQSKLNAEIDTAGNLKVGVKGLPDVDEYLVALHAAERNATIAGRNPNLPQGGSGMTDAQAAAIVAKIDASPHAATYKQAARLARRLNDATLDQRLADGLITPEQHKAWKAQWKNYVPLRTDMEAEGFGNLRTGSKFSIKGKESQAATGRTSMADSPLTFSILQAREGLIRGEKNRVLQRLHTFIETNPDPVNWKVTDTLPSKKVLSGDTVRDVPDFTYGDQPGVVSVKVGGKQKYIEFLTPESAKIATAMKAMNSQQANSFERAMQGFRTYFRAITTTLSPTFYARNIIKDVQTAAFNTAADKTNGAALSQTRNWGRSFKAIRDVLKDRTSGSTPFHDYAREFLAEGGQTGGFTREDFSTTQRDLVKDIADAKTKVGIVKALRAVDQYVQRIGTASENATRLAAYAQARKSGQSREKAAAYAKSLTTDFNRRGEYGRTMNLYWIYSNAAVQGSARFMKSAVTTPRGRKMTAGMALASFAYYSALPELLGTDDEGRSIYDQIPEHERDSNLILPAFGALGKDRYAKIPLGYGINTVMTMGRKLAELKQGRAKPGAALGDMASSFANAFNPLGGGDNLVSSLTPTILKPIVELAMNRDWADREIVPSQMPFGPQKPDSQLAQKDTTGPAKAMSQSANLVTGGDEVTSGKIDVSPATIDHFGKFLTGSIGRLLGQAASLPGKIAKGEATSRAVPILSSFVGEPPANIEAREFYEAARAAEDAVSDLKHYEATGQAAKARNLKADRGKELAFARWAQEHARELREAREAVDNTTGKEARQGASDKLTAAYQEFNRSYRAGNLPETENVENQLATMRKAIQDMRPKQEKTAVARSDANTELTKMITNADLPTDKKRALFAKAGIDAPASFEFDEKLADLRKKSRAATESKTRLSGADARELLRMEELNTRRKAMEKRQAR